jgi:hypothetical protein
MVGKLHRNVNRLFYLRLVWSAFPFTVAAAILKSNQAFACKRGYGLPRTVSYLDYNTSGGHRLPCTVRYLDYNTSGYRLPCTVVN